MAVADPSQEIGDFRAMPPSAWVKIYARFTPSSCSQDARITESSCLEGSDGASSTSFETAQLRTMPADAWSSIHNVFEQDSTEIFEVPRETLGTPVGPRCDDGEPLCFLTNGSPSPQASNDDTVESEAKCALKFKGATHALGAALPAAVARFALTPESAGSDVSLLEAVEPLLPANVPEDASEFSPPAAPAACDADVPKSTWKRISVASAQAKEQMTDKVQRSIGYMKPTQMPETVQRSIGYMKPTQMPETMQKSVVFVKEKAGSARDKANTVSAVVTDKANTVSAVVSDKANTVSAAVTDKASTVSAVVTAAVSQTTQKGFELAKGMRRPRRGGA